LRTFVTDDRGLWIFAVDRVRNIQVGQGQIEPMGEHVTEVQYIFWRATQVRWPVNSWEDQARTYTHHDACRAPHIKQVIPHYGIKSALKGMAFLGFSNAYEGLLYMATGIGRIYPKSQGHHVIAAGIDDLKELGVQIPADAEIADAHVVMFQE